MESDGRHAIPLAQRGYEHRYSVRLYTLVELIKMLEAVGLRVQASYGGLDGSRLTLDSNRLVVLSRKFE